MSLASALRTRDIAELPNRRQEGWRWTDIAGQLRTLPPASPVSDATPADPFGPEVGGEPHVFVNGRALGASDAIVPAGEVRRIRRRFISATDGTGHQLASRIEVGEGGRALVIESHEATAAGYVADVATHIRLAPNAVMHRLVVMDEAADAIVVATTEVELSAGAQFHQTVLMSGSRRQRYETVVTHPGAGATVRLDGVYLVDGTRHADLTTRVVHAGTDGSTVQVTKGVVGGQGRGVFQGAIIVSPGSDRTDARMRHDALLLSDRAEVDAKPELEIYADDVQCAHGNTVGALDEEALFYARSRGIPLVEARRMLTDAFVGEVVHAIPEAALQQIAHEWVTRRLEALEP
ncbi:MAG: Fe-S cluster assembly protein SufD [Caulobacteraceae bacterium]